MSTISALPVGFTSGSADVNGVRIRYVRGGQGEPVVLIHGWPQTWYEWRLIMPRLAEHYDVIAVDLRGAGGSSRPSASAGYDSRTLATDVRELLRHLGFETAHVVGHDIGMLVAYAYAVTFPAEVQTLTIIDGVAVGIEPYSTEFLRSPRSWNFGFNQTGDLAERLTAGREDVILNYLFDNNSDDPSRITSEAREEYVRAYSEPGAFRAALEWYLAFPKDAEFNIAAAHLGKLKMPVLTLGGAQAMGPIMVPMMNQLAEDVRGAILPACGHYVPEEQPKMLVDHLSDFLGEFSIDSGCPVDEPVAKAPMPRG